MRRIVALVLIGAGILIAAGSAFAMNANEETATQRAEGRITKVVVENDNGDITVRPGDDAKVKRVERWNYMRPSYSQDVEDGTLIVRARCPGINLFNNCAVTLELTVPEGAEVTSSTTNGDTDVTGINGKRVSVSSTNGDLTLDDLGAEAVRAHTTNGDIDVAIGERPDAIDVSSTNGDIDVSVPKGSYDIRTNTTNGDVSVNGLEDDSDATSELSASTTNGDIQLRVN
jgi:hypothetical protein